MKTLRKILALVFILTLLSCMSVSAFAADGPNYTIRIFSGDQGTIDGGSVKTYVCKKGETVNFSDDSVTLSDSKYYVKGIREAGLGNETVVHTVTVSGDADYVVAYGVKSKAVKYTVKYVSSSGAPLDQDREYYGNVGDKPVVAFLYVEGYIPQSYNLTKTLSANEADNVFTFTYSPIPTTPVVTPVVPGNNNQGNNNQGNNNQGNNNQGNTQGNGQVTGNVVPVGGQTTPPAGGQTDPGSGTQAPVEPTMPPEPEEIIDLDVPLAGPEAEKEDTPSLPGLRIPKVVTIAGIFAILAALAILARSVINKNRKNGQAD